MGGRIAAFCKKKVLPVLAIASAAGLLSGLAETVRHTATVLEAIAGAGFVLLVALPLGVILQLVGRLFLYLWDAEALREKLSDQRGAAPLAAAWVSYLLVAGIALTASTFHGLGILYGISRSPAVILVAMPIVVLGTTFVLALLSRPIINLITFVFVTVEDRRAKRDLPARVTLQNSAIIALAITCALCIAAWYVTVLPRIGHLDVSFLGYVFLFLFLLVLFALFFKQSSRIRTGLYVATPCIALGFLLTAGFVRYQRPRVMLDVWGGTTVAGGIIDGVVDIGASRREMTLEGIEPTPLPGAKHPNVVLITVDTMRADLLQAYQGPARTPALFALAEQGALFKRAFSPGNVTRRSLPTIATGLSPNRVRGRVAGWALRMDPRHILLAERLRAGGYDTAGFFCCLSQFGAVHQLGLIRGLDHVALEYDGAPLTSMAVSWLGEREKKSNPLFLWLHYIEPHNWAVANKKKADTQADTKPRPRSKRERYQQTLEETDGFLGDLLKGIQEHLGPNTVIVVTSDHGEGLGDHGFPYHSGSLFNSEIHVPLIVTGPGIKPQTIHQAVGLVDLAPTIMELAGFQPPGMPEMDGLSLAPELLGKREDALGRGEAYSVIVKDRSVKTNQAAIVSGRYKLIVSEDKTQLYDMVSDPKERKDLAKTLPAYTKAMEARLQRRQRLDKVAPF